ncbi:DUF6350 family protein [Gordonia sp. HY002]|uniref:cell division protein PerM n=1 Tax=Gordonia zhenghanii TaxID=2911516 RepID=UPI001EEFBC45|nr:DUF6350 family protein [Gordonia zhenghanii]MCF8570255.1 DUF6350 family protein [Gordonia zhenghanii]MCF8606832.1 DUF6350 family protein [Gordonia zhenghanii]
MSGTSNSLATRLRQVRLARRADTAPRKAATWDLVKVAFLVPGLSIIAIVVVLGIVRILAGDGLSGIMSATAAGWLAVNQVPVTISGVTLGVLPLLPTLLVCAGTVKVVADGASTARELPDLVGIVGAALGGSVLVTALSLAVVADGAAVSAVGQPDPLSAFGYTILIQGAAVVVGIAIPSLRPILDEFAVPATERVGARGGVIAFGVLVSGGALLVFGSIVMHWGSVSTMIADGNSFDGYLGLTGLSILYLPNMVVGAAAVTTGTTAQLGDTVFDAFDVSRGAVPPLPVVSALPETGLGGLGALLFIVPLAAGVLLGWYCRSTDPIRHLRAVAIGAAVAAALVVVASWVSGGRLGELGRTGVNTATAGVFTFAWLMLAGALVVGVMWAASGGITRARNGDDDLDSWLDDPPRSSSDVEAESDDDTDSPRRSSPAAPLRRTGVETESDTDTDELELDPASDPEPDRHD